MSLYVTGVNGTLQHLIGVLAGILFGDVQSNQPLSIMDGSVEGDLGCGNRDAETSLLRMHLLLNQTLQEPEIAMLIGHAAGIPAVFYYGTSSREQGRAMRDALPKLYASAVPSVYICGGASIFRGVLDTVSRFNIDDGTWEALPPMPTARRLCAGAAAGGSLYVFGGEQEGYEAIPLWYSELMAQRYQQLSTAECFDPFKGMWAKLPAMPTARAGCAAAAAGGMVYVVGGRINETIHGIVERFDTNVNRWERLPRMPTARSGCAAVSLLGMLYVIGGKGLSGHILSVVERFDPSTGWWQNVPSMHSPRSAFSAGAVGGKIFAAGGFNGVEGIDMVECFDQDVGVWETQPQMSTSRIGGTAVVAAGKIFILGGKTGGEMELSCECFDPANGVWTPLPPMPQRHVYCAGGALIGCV